MISDRAFAALIAAAYTDSPRWTYADTRACYAEVDGLAVVTIPGTDPESVANWLRDLDAAPFEHPQLGTLHRGFYEGGLGLYQQVRTDLAGHPWAVGGHSLGGAEALICAALGVLDDWAPVRCVALAPARAGFATLRNILRTVAPAVYRLGRDLVPDVPIGFALAVDAWHQVGVTTGDPIADHSVDRYVRALEQEEPADDPSASRSEVDSASA